MASVVYQGQPPCDPKTLGGLLGQRREIDAWIRSREVKCALPQRVAVRAPNRICKPLFLNANGGFAKVLVQHLSTRGPPTLCPWAPRGLCGGQSRGDAAVVHWSGRGP